MGIINQVETLPTSVCPKWKCTGYQLNIVWLPTGQHVATVSLNFTLYSPNFKTLDTKVVTLTPPQSDAFNQAFSTFSYIYDFAQRLDATLEDPTLQGTLEPNSELDFYNK